MHPDEAGNMAPLATVSNTLDNVGTLIARISEVTDRLCGPVAPMSATEVQSQKAAGVAPYLAEKAVAVDGFIMLAHQQLDRIVALGL